MKKNFYKNTNFNRSVENFNKNSFFKFNSGFTIIETLIAVSLFLVVVTSGMASLLNTTSIHKKSQDMRSIMDNMSFILEDISRNLRTGSNYYCITGNDTLSNISVAKSGQNCWGIAFEPTGGSGTDPGDQWVYYISETGKIFKSTHGSTGFIQMTPNEVTMSGFSSFSVYGAEPEPTNTEQPFVSIKLDGEINSKNIKTPFSLQTSVSQRLADINLIQ